MVHIGCGSPTFAPIANVGSISFSNGKIAANVTMDMGNIPSVSYQQSGGVKVEIPSLGINIPIVGVSLKSGT